MNGLAVVSVPPAEGETSKTNQYGLWLLIGIGDLGSFPWEEHQPVNDSESNTFSCFFFRIKKQWWDQIPNPAHSPVMAIVIQESQVGERVGSGVLDYMYQETELKMSGMLRLFIGFRNCP